MMAAAPRAFDPEARLFNQFYCACRLARVSHTNLLETKYIFYSDCAAARQKTGPVHGCFKPAAQWNRLGFQYYRRIALQNRKTAPQKLDRNQRQIPKELLL
jgi:hypothetical protein